MKKVIRRFIWKIVLIFGSSTGCLVASGIAVTAIGKNLVSKQIIEIVLWVLLAVAVVTCIGLITKVSISFSKYLKKNGADSFKNGVNLDNDQDNTSYVTNKLFSKDFSERNRSLELWIRSKRKDQKSSTSKHI